MFLTPLTHKPSQQGAVGVPQELFVKWCYMRTELHNSESHIYRLPETKFTPDCEGKPGRITTQGPFDASCLDKHECFQLMLPQVPLAE